MGSGYAVLREQVEHMDTPDGAHRCIKALAPQEVLTHEPKATAVSYNCACAGAVHAITSVQRASYSKVGSIVYSRYQRPGIRV